MSKNSKMSAFRAAGMDRNKPLLIHFDLNPDRFYRIEKATDHVSYVMDAVVRDGPPKAAIRGGLKKPVKSAASITWGKRMKMGPGPSPVEDSSEKPETDRQTLMLTPDWAYILLKREADFIQLQRIRDIKMGDVLELQTCIAKDNEDEVKKLGEQYRQLEKEVKGMPMCKLSCAREMELIKTKLNDQNGAFRQWVVEWNEYLESRVEQLLWVAESVLICKSKSLPVPADIFDDFDDEEEDEDLEELERLEGFPPPNPMFINAYDDGMEGEDAYSEKDLESEPDTLVVGVGKVDEIIDEEIVDDVFDEENVDVVVDKENIYEVVDEGDDDEWTDVEDSESDSDTKTMEENVDYSDNEREVIGEFEEKILNTNPAVEELVDDNGDEDFDGNKDKRVKKRYTSPERVEEFESSSNPQTEDDSVDEGDGSDDEWTDVDDDESYTDSQTGDGSVDEGDGSDDEWTNVEDDETESGPQTTDYDDGEQESTGCEETDEINEDSQTGYESVSVDESNGDSEWTDVEDSYGNSDLQSDDQSVDVDENDEGLQVENHRDAEGDRRDED